MQVVNSVCFGTLAQAANHAFHVDCARCSKCGHFFNEDEDMCVLGEKGYICMYIRMHIYIRTYIHVRMYFINVRTYVRMYPVPDTCS